MNVRDETCTVDGCTERAYIWDRDGQLCRAHWDAQEATQHAEEKQATLDAGGPWPQTCPRRGGEIGPWERGEGLDTWDVREQMHKGLRARHCSFCGSLHPDDFMRLIEEGWIVGPTDKPYKAYLGPSSDSSQDTKFYYQHLSEDQRHRFVALYNDGGMKVGGGGFYRLPFFVKPRLAADPPGSRDREEQT